MPNHNGLPQFLDEIVRVGSAELVALAAMPERTAHETMTRVAHRIVGHFARTTMYVPAPFARRNEEIWRRYRERGGDAAETLPTSPYSRQRILDLAAEFSLTERQIYSILAVMRLRERAESAQARQGVGDHPEAANVQ